MILGIDLHNIRDGGGVNYIRNMLEIVDPAIDGFSQIHLFGAPRVLAMFPDRPFIVKHGYEALDRPLPLRLLFVATRLPGLLRHAGCDVLYSPGGVAFGNFRPYVTISRNMMPFSPQFWEMYPRFSFDRLRLRLLRWVHAWSFERADGMIFLSGTAKQAVSTFLSRALKQVVVIPHGVDRERFKPMPRTSISARDADASIRLIYPSRLEPYKHQIEVVAAISALWQEFPGIELVMCGPANPGYLPRVEASIDAIDPERRRIRYVGEVPNAELPMHYAESDLLLFASSCENLPNILIEAMACGIPVCSSDRPPMPEIGKQACLYFDPSSPDSIAACIRTSIIDSDATAARAELGARQAEEYSWVKTTRRTFGFIAETAKTKN